MPQMIELAVHEISTPDQPANRRKFLIAKSATEGARHDAALVITQHPFVDAVQRALQVIKAEGVAPTFEDAMLRQRFGPVLDELSKRYGSLLGTVDGILTSDGGDKPALILDAVKAFTASVAEVMPSLVESLTKSDGDHHPLVKALRAVRDAAPKEKSMTPEEITAAVAALPEDLQKHIESLTQAAAATTAEAVQKQIDDAVAAAKEPTEPTAEEKLKALPPEGRELVEKAQADATAAREEAKKAQAQVDAETAKRVEGEHRAASVAAFKGLPGERADVVKVLHAIDTITDEANRTLVTDALKAASTALVEAGILKEAGKRTDADAGEAGEALEAAAKALMAKDESLTIEQARVEALEADANLYAAHVAKQRARAHSA